MTAKDHPSIQLAPPNGRKAQVSDVPDVGPSLSLLHLADVPDLGRWVPEFGLGFYREILVKPLRLLYEDHGHTLVVTYVHRQAESIEPDRFPDEAEG